VKVAFSDHSKADRIFGGKPKTSLEEGIKAMAEWVAQHGARASNVFDGIEIERNLPASWAVPAQK
jgi:UDP-glucose 4-epimerase